MADTSTETIGQAFERAKRERDELIARWKLFTIAYGVSPSQFTTSEMDAFNAMERLVLRIEARNG